MKRLFQLLAVAALGVATLQGADSAPKPATVDFKKDIQSLFESRCYECHGPTKQKSGLRLDRKSSVFQGGDSGKPAVVAHKSAESVLIQKVTSEDSDEIMPPKGKKLSASQIELLKNWIDQGAVWPADEAPRKHWAYIAPVTPLLPKVKNRAWCRNPIDFFVLERLEKEKLSTSPEADRATLIRRVSLDITGLPPPLEEVDAFVADKSPLAYEALVDRLLASPRYGERWARPWLDLARYADTQGYEKDSRRSMWPYRDWVVSALNRNLPFDQFTMEQLAGDLLPKPTRDQKIATGFHRNTMTNTEGGTDDEEFRHEAIVDRVNTTMSVWMGTTFGCAQCHNHKYDPITTKEYYQIYAFLNNTADSDKDDESPTLKIPSQEQETKLASLREKIKTLEQKYNADTPELARAQSEWEHKTAAALTNWRALEPTKYESLGGATLIKTNESILATGKNPSNDTYVILSPLNLAAISGLRLEVLPDPSLPQKSLGRHTNGSFVLSRFEAAIGSGDKLDEFTPLHFKSAEADYSQSGHSVTNLISDAKTSGWAIGAADPKLALKRSAYFSLSSRIAFESNAVLKVTLRHESQFPEANVGRVRLYATDAPKVEPAISVSNSIAKILAKAAGKRSDKEKSELTAHFRTVWSELKPVREQLAKTREQESAVDKAIPKTSIMVELDKPRQTHRLIRGGFLSKGEAVAAATPAVFHPLSSSPSPLNGLRANASAKDNSISAGVRGEAPKDGTDSPPLNRLTLARWLVDTNNPLTARVIMNRIWEQYFGIGIVETTQDFGTQGEPPSNQKLLDWLATEFMRQNWNLKAMHKLIVMSAAYRQSSKATPELLQRDPFNRLLARGPHVRLEAEQIRDQALAVSGLLSAKFGGPSVMPPQPDGLWQVVYSGDKWETSKGEDRYRRGLYTFWRRSMPHPAMTTFDAPTREFCVLKRDRSDTPLQALVLLNDPEYLECAQALARRVLREKADDEERAAYAFRLCLARAPKPAEVQRLVAVAQKEREHFAKDTAAAKTFANASEKQSLDPVQLAAWTVVGNVLLNLDEMVTKN